MRTRIYALTIALTVLLAASIPASAGGAGSQTDREDWGVVQSVTPGTELIIDTKDGRTVKGRFSSATDSTLSLSGNGRVFDLDRDNIRRVHLQKGNSRAKTALAGAHIGGGVGLGIGVRVVTLKALSGDTDISPMRLTLAGAALGAVVGAIRGGKRRGDLIYEVK